MSTQGRVRCLLEPSTPARMCYLFNQLRYSPVLVLSLVLGCHAPLPSAGPDRSLHPSTTGELTFERMEVEWEMQLPSEYGGAFIIAEGPVLTHEETASQSGASQTWRRRYLTERITRQGLVPLEPYHSNARRGGSLTNVLGNGVYTSSEPPWVAVERLKQRATLQPLWLGSQGLRSVRQPQELPWADLMVVESGLLIAASKLNSGTESKTLVDSFNDKHRLFRLSLPTTALGPCSTKLATKGDLLAVTVGVRRRAGQPSMAHAIGLFHPKTGAQRGEVELGHGYCVEHLLVTVGQDSPASGWALVSRWKADGSEGLRRHGMELVQFSSTGSIDSRLVLPDFSPGTLELWRESELLITGRVHDAPTHGTQPYDPRHCLFKPHMLSGFLLFLDLRAVALRLTCIETQFRGVPQFVVPVAGGVAILQTAASNPGFYGKPYRAAPHQASLSWAQPEWVKALR